MLKPRPYQAEAVTALDNFLSTKETNPCVVLPTGAGKSFVMAYAIARWRAGAPDLRALVLAHRKELVDQNSKEFIGVDPSADVGVYAAGLGRKEEGHLITFASIDTIYNKAFELPPVDVVIVDEAHRIPVKGEGKYRRFIQDERKVNPYLRVVGFTATPFRLSSGPICHKDHILNEICYEANVGDLIEAGYLSKLRSKVGKASPNLSEVKKVGGEYQTKSLGEIVGKDETVWKAVESAVQHLNEENRKCVVWFCVDVAHCEKVKEYLRRLGEIAPAVTGSTSVEARDRAVEDFRQGKYRHILNVNVFTEGFNVKQVDAVVLLRPTLSKGLYAQMVGRGLRLHPSKQDCLILDYARCIETHGPIDQLEAGRVRLHVCGRCEESFDRALGQCPHCGWKIPKEEKEAIERAERERQMHEAEAAQLAILGSIPQTRDVDDVTVARHAGKLGNPDSVCITYRCQYDTPREWLCFDHEGYPGKKAREWWNAVFGAGTGDDMTVDKALSNMFLGFEIKERIKQIVVRRDGKYWKVLNHIKRRD